MPMDREIKAQWVADLRSGEYRQGFMTLRDSIGQFCCLGVLCEQAARAGIVTRKDFLSGASAYRDADGRRPYFSDLPGAVQAWAGLDRANPVVLISGTATTLIHVNDTERLSFSQIADLIEEYL